MTCIIPLPVIGDSGCDKKPGAAPGLLVNQYQSVTSSKQGKTNRDTETDSSSTEAMVIPYCDGGIIVVTPPNVVVFIAARATY
jgi:hypothetical protein